MDLPRYIAERGRGTVAAIVRDSRLSRNTVEKAARGEAISVPAAKKLSDATGGEVTASHLAGLGA